MQPVLVMIPEIKDPLKRTKYMAETIRYTMNLGYFPLSKDVHEVYRKIENDPFLEQMLGICKTVYLFIDFGVSDLMARAAEEAAKQDIPVVYTKLITEEQAKSYITPEDILQEVCDKFNIDPEVLKTKTRKREFVDIRDIYFRRAREVLGKSYTYQSIGSVVNRDHATAMWGEREATQTLEIRKRYEQHYGSTDSSGQ